MSIFVHVMHGREGLIHVPYYICDLILNWQLTREGKSVSIKGYHMNAVKSQAIWLTAKSKSGSHFCYILSMQYAYVYIIPSVLLCML